VSLLDAGGAVVTDAADAASVQFDGVAGHFSSYAVAIVTPADSSPQGINGSGSGGGGGGGGGASGGSAPVTDKTPPVLSNLSAKPPVVRLAGAHHKARSASVRFTVSEPGLDRRPHVLGPAVRARSSPAATASPPSRLTRPATDQTRRG
jgi:hypothetical protein